jgi:phosphate transport system permease protein
VAVILGMGRAIGETVAVALVIGPASTFPKSLTTPTHTLTTKILMEMGESSGVQRSVLFAMALVLLLLSMAMILMVRLTTRKKAFAR